MKEYLTVKEVCSLFRISKSSIYKLTKEDPSFPAFNIGQKKKIVVHHKDFINWIKSKNFKEDLIRLPSNTIVLRRRIHETPKHQY